MLTELLGKVTDARLQVAPQTDDADAATAWLGYDQSAGVEGVVAKRSDRSYPRPNRRQRVKVRRRHTFDAVVCGVTGRPGAVRLVLGAYDQAGKLWTLGMSQPVPASAMAALAPLMAAATLAERPLRSRFDELRSEWWRLPAELVAEVDCFHLDGGRWLRQPAPFLRWRPDRSPEQIRLLPARVDLRPRDSD